MTIKDLKYSCFGSGHAILYIVVNKLDNAVIDVCLCWLYFSICLCFSTLLYSIHVTDSAPCSTSGVTAGLTKLTTRKDNCNAEREFLQGATVTEACDSSEDIFGLSTDSLSRLRSPSVLEVREKGYERLKEELAKAQRVSKKIFYSSICYIRINIFTWGGDSNEIIAFLHLPLCMHSVSFCWAAFGSL